MTIHVLTTTPPVPLSTDMEIEEIPLAGSVPLLKTGVNDYSPQSGVEDQSPYLVTAGVHPEYIVGDYITNKTARGAYICIDVTATSGADVTLQFLWRYMFLDGSAGVDLINDVWPAGFVAPTKRLFLMYPGAGLAFYQNPVVRDAAATPKLIPVSVPLPKISNFAVVKNGGTSWSGSVRVTFLP